jgi:hypothetical protein
MDRPTGGTKRSSQLVFRRRLTLVRRLLRGPASGDELLTFTRAALGEWCYPSAATTALKHDLEALRAEYGCRIIRHHQRGSYAIESLGTLALLDLSDAAIDALHTLRAGGAVHRSAREHAGTRELLDQVVHLLYCRKDAHPAAHAAPRLMARECGATPDRATAATMRLAIIERRELIFDYLEEHGSTLPRRHRVAPYGFFTCEHGEIHLDATLLDVTPACDDVPLTTVAYQLSRVVAGSARHLPQHLPPERPQPPSYRLRYRLHPSIARQRKVEPLFADAQIEYHEDGSATATATVMDLRQARQALLRYGDGCEVLEPSELVELIRSAAEGLLRLYGAAA